MRTFFKFVIGIPIVTTFLISLIFLALGVYEASQGVIGILQGLIESDARPGLLLFQALDLFLIGFLFLYFSSLGFAQLFFPKPSRVLKLLEMITPPWLHVETFTNLN